MNRDRIFLILDDISVNRVILKGLLSSTYKKSIVVEASTGIEAITLHQELVDSLYPIDCVFLDYQLPDGNGIEVAKIIRSRGYSGPMVMVTSMVNGTLDIIDRSGMFCRVLRKPLSSSIITQHVVEVLRCHEEHSATCDRMVPK